MTKITTLDKIALKALAPAIEAELKALGERLGLAITYNGGQYGDGAEATLKLLIKVDDPATKLAAAKANWDRNCRIVGIDYTSDEDKALRPEDFGTEFNYAGAVYRTTGIAVKGKNSTKFPILCEIVSGKDAGSVRMLPERASALIRAATDAKAKPPTKAKVAA